MFTSKKRKHRRRLPAVLRSKNPSKGTAQASSSGDTKAQPEVPVQGPRTSVEESDGKPAPPPKQNDTRGPRNGSKIFSWFRLWKSGNEEPATSLIQPDLNATLSLPMESDDGPDLGSAQSSSTAANPASPFATSLRLVTTSLPPAVDHGDNGVPLTEISLSMPAGEHAVSHHAPQWSRSQHSSRSSPKFTHILTHKISTAFINPTVVRRRSLQSRPSIHSLQSEAEAVFQKHIRESTVLETTDPSSLSTSGITSSPTGISTGQTSLLSDLSGRRLSDVKKPEQLLADSKGGGLSQDSMPVKSLTPIPEMYPLEAPSIVTVETTASAKIFFETHFNSIFATPVTPRSQRRRTLEQQLLNQSLTFDERAKIRRLWARRESGHLRQLRALKTKALDQSSGPGGVYVAGYEVVKVLGKGSFGVVRLVREMDGVGMITKSDNTGLGRPSEERQTRPKIGMGPTPSVRQRATSLFRAARQMHTHVYAMKVIRKSDMLRNSQEAHLRAERDFLVASEGSRWIVPLVASFQDSTNLYLVMEYMVGGDFLGLLIREQILEEDVAKWYIAEMILCIEEAHALKWIHRDVKPDNFLISASGHLKISDFGLAFDGHWSHDQSYFHTHRYSLLDKLGLHVQGDSIDRKEDQEEADEAKGGDRAELETPEEAALEEDPEGEGILNWRNRTGMRHLAMSVVGTSQYMAPEVIRGDPYDGRCDWWSLGIILYECFYGYTPFCMDNRNDTKKRILHHATALRFPIDIPVSESALDLMKRLLQEKEFRLSSRKYIINDFDFWKQPSSRTRPRGGNSPTKVAGGGFYMINDRYPNLHEPPTPRQIYVYPDDACDIKAHSFFQGVPWSTMHLTKPPFVPKIRSWEDTRYFEEEASISDVDDGPSSIDDDDDDGKEGVDKNGQGHGSQTKVEKGGENDHETELKTFDNLLAETQNNKSPPGPAKLSKHARERRRPRDKILRDKEVGKQVLELRKRSAFLGYAYRRPHGVENEFIGINGDGGADERDVYIDDTNGGMSGGMDGSAETV
ncbi:MAG: deoxycytidyl transferase [Watsoniomyces obsoletus]|nr:MAG: deoxycytidyl transferase [Watsoniomyces obsoletus]